MARPTVATLLVLLVLLGPGGARGEEGPYGTTYSAAELAALDRALHAAGATREDLAFRKDMAEGRLCVPVVRRMLADPLSIAPVMDGFVADARTLEGDVRPAVAWLLAALGLLEEDHFDALRQGQEAQVAREGSLPAHARPATPSDLAQALADLLEDERPWMLLSEDPLEEPDPADRRLAVLRRYLPGELDWHDVFPSPYDVQETEALETVRAGHPGSWVQDLAAGVDVEAVTRWWLERFHVPVAWLAQIPASAFPADAPLVLDTPHGRVGIGTPGDDLWAGDWAALIDPGGNDRYLGCRLGAAWGTDGHRVGFFADLGGDDVYDCGDVDVTLGAAILGIAAFYDLGMGNDRYVGGHASLGAAMGGVAVFYDDGGSDVYDGRTFTQGAAGYGIAVFLDDALQPRPVVPTDAETPDPIAIGAFDNDRLHAWANAQGFARPWSVALCVNRRGHDVYEAGGVYLHAPLFSDRYQSFAQGFAIGERDIDLAGGIAFLVDLEGNDRYLGDVYDQGVGYWYSAGLLYDGAGNDVYEMTQYGQGSGIHLAVGGLVDVGGHDTYVMHSGLGQGGSHDFAASILHDRGGNDRYHGSTACNGTGLTNSVGILIDRAGDDTYAGRRSGGVNVGRPARGFASLGVLLDLGGQDDYLGPMADGATWRQTDVAAGVDVGAPPGAQPSTPGIDQPGADVVVPPVCRTEAALDETVFQELWDLARRWEVGDNRVVVPAARARLVAYGAPVLPHLDRKLETDAGGLDLRAYAGVLAGLRARGADDAAAVEAWLAANLAHANAVRRRMALALVGEVGAQELAEAVAGLLAGPDEAQARRAADVLRTLQSHAGDAALRTWLDVGGEERRQRAALGTLLGLGADAYDAVRPLLDHRLLSVRSALAEGLALHLDRYGSRLVEDLGAGDLDARARRTVLDALARAPALPAAGEQGEALVLSLAALLRHEDWGVRGDAVRVLVRLLHQDDVPLPLRDRARAALDACRAAETDPFVVGQLDLR